MTVTDLDHLETARVVESAAVRGRDVDGRAEREHAITEGEWGLDAEGAALRVGRVDEQQLGEWMKRVALGTVVATRQVVRSRR